MTADTLKEPLVEELIDDIFEARTAATASKIREQSKRPYMYLSDVHQCTRHNYYSMVEGDKRRPITPWLQELFTSGNIWEDETVRELMALRFEVIAGQQSIAVKYGGRDEKQRGTVIGKGRIDGKIRYKKREIPFEIKSMGENVYRGVNCVDDLFKYEYTEKYVRQLLMYLWGEGVESGLFILNDRGNHWKLLPIQLGNYLDYCEKVLKNMEAAWDAKIAEKEPDRIFYNHRVCGNCQFNAICCPETVLEGADVLDDPELEAAIKRHEELKPLAKEFKDAHDDLKDLFSNKPQTTIGNFVVTPKKTVKRGTITVSKLPSDVQRGLEQYRGEAKDSWSFKVDDITKKPESDV